MNNNLNQQSFQSEKQVGVAKAIMLGHLVVNGPMVLIMLGSIGPGFLIGSVLEALFPAFQDMSFLVAIIICSCVGFLFGWLWWSFSVPRWRQWALQHGAPAEPLHKWAVLTGLEWPKGHIFEKAEFKIDK